MKFGKRDNLEKNFQNPDISLLILKIIVPLVTPRVELGIQVETYVFLLRILIKISFRHTINIGLH